MNKQCEICGVLFHPLNIRKKCCSKKCYDELYATRHKHRIASGLLEDLKLSTGRYSQLKRRVKAKGFTYLMTLDAYMKKINKPCYYCDKVTYGVEKGVGLDRLNNDKEYTDDNTVPCCGECNRSRSDVHTSSQYKKMMNVDIYIDALNKLNKIQKIERSLSGFIEHINSKY